MSTRPTLLQIQAVCTLILTEKWYDAPTKKTAEKVSRLSLVDLAGSERQSKTGATGDTLKEGAKINQSLSTLGLVIKALADQSKQVGGRKKKDFVPYRDSVLTWLLKDNLGGNSKTLMLATVSPSVDNYDETLSTLRYADSAKKITNHAVVNEDPNAKMIRGLREELDMLRAQVGGGGGGVVGSAEHDEMQAKLRETEELMKSMNMSWEEKLKESEAVLAANKKLLEDHGARLEGGEHSLSLKSTKPHLVSIPTGYETSINIYSLNAGITRVGMADYEDEPQDICLAGEGMEEEQCMLELEERMNESLGALEEVVTLHPIGEHCYVNEECIDDSVELNHGAIVQFGEDNLLRFNNPIQVAQMQQQGIKLKVIPARLVGSASAMEEAKLKEQDALLKEERAKMDVEKAALLAAKEAAEKDAAAAAAAALAANEATHAEEKRLADEKESENERLRLQIEEMQVSKEAAEAKAKADMAKHDAEVAAKAVAEAQRQNAKDADREQQLVLERALLEKEAAMLARLEEQRRLDQEAEAERQKEIARQIAEERAMIAAERERAEQATRDAQAATQLANDEREKANQHRVEAERLANEREMQLAKDQLEREKVRLHHIKMAQMEAELSQRQDAAAARAAGNPFGAAPAASSVAAPTNPFEAPTNPFSDANAGAAGGGGGGGGGGQSEMDKMREQMRKYQERQEMTEVANAGQEDETDRKIAAFKKAKMEFTRRQTARDLKKKPLEGTSGMSAQEISQVQPDEVIPQSVNLEVFMGKRASEQKEDKSRGKDFEGESTPWLLKQWKEMDDQPWFQGFVKRTDAVAQLQGKPIGTFLVRVSETKPGHYAISVSSLSGVDQILILPSYAGRDPTAPGGTRYRLGPESRVLFNTVPKLIAYYLSKPYHQARGQPPRMLQGSVTKGSG